MSNTVGRVSAFAAATGIGSWPGTAPRPAAQVVVGELHRLPHLVELPARGVGADVIGRAGALLVDIAIDTTPRGYRLTARPGGVTRRARSLLDEDVDALEEAWERAGLRGGGRTVKLQAPGPVTLAAQLELAGGHRAITDGAALRDLAASLAEGVAMHQRQVAKRLGAAALVQLDEPLLPAALAGRLSGVTSLSPVHPVDDAVAIGLLDLCVGALDGSVALHCCAPDIPWNVLKRSNIDAVAVDASTVRNSHVDGLGEFLDAGRSVLLGVIPSTARAVPPSVSDVVKATVSLTDRLGLGRAALRTRVGVTPACGLAGATAKWATSATRLAQKVADVLAEDPEGI